jgi:hypothetical protein
MRWLLPPLLLLAACATQPVPPPAREPVPPAAPAVAMKPQPLHYRCDQGLEFDVRFGDDEAQILVSGQEPETLLRDAGGTSPQHSVYSSTRAKVEFGLEPEGRGALLNLLSPPLETRCVRS